MNTKHISLEQKMWSRVNKLMKKYAVTDPKVQRAIDKLLDSMDIMPELKIGECYLPEELEMHGLSHLCFLSLKGGLGAELWWADQQVDKRRYLLIRQNGHYKLQKIFGEK